MKDYPVNRVRDWLKGALKSLTVWFNSYRSKPAPARSARTVGSVMFTPAP